MIKTRVFCARLWKAMRLFVLLPSERDYLRQLRASGLFDASFYRGAHGGLHPLYRRFAMRHFLRHGEGAGLRPNPNFSPEAYLRLNPDVARAGLRPFRHFLSVGRAEGRVLSAPDIEALPAIAPPVLRFDPTREKAAFAVHAHVYYPDLWPDFAQRLTRLEIDFDLFVTLTWRGTETALLQQLIEQAFPGARVFCLANQGRDILPFLTLINAGAFDGYAAVAKIHTKKSPHRTDGDIWRNHLIDGILPQEGLAAHLRAFLEDEDAGLWVADGQHYRGRNGGALTGPEQRRSCAGWSLCRGR
nr:rhamnan synthesis F family protein [Aquicoccus sp. G2-2]MEA1115080.1 rhamnan synthesis F family protein [Aquicoccus sp. G2-2]